MKTTTRQPAANCSLSSRRNPCLIEPLEGRIAPAVTVLSVGSLALDNDADGAADPGDRLHYTVTVANTGPGTLTGMSFTELLNDPNLTLVAGSVNVSPLAIDDTFTAIGNTTLVVGTPAAVTGPAKTQAGSATGNDFEFLTDTFVISSFQATSANLGTVSMVTSGVNMGSFSYLPAAGFTGTDTFTYTLTDAGIDGNLATLTDNLTSVGTVTVTVQGTDGTSGLNAPVLWYVDSSAAAGGDGRSSSPFDSLADVTGATGPDAAGETLFLHPGAYTGGITLLNNQTLWGRGETLIVNGITLLAAGSDPTIANAAGDGVTLASGNTLKGFTVGNTTGFDIANTTTATVGALTISNVDLTGTGGLFRADSGGTLTVTFDTAGTTSAAGHGIHLGGATSGSFTVSAGALSGVAGTDVFVNGGTATVTIAASITSNAGGSVEIASHGTNNVTLSGALNITGGSGVSVHDNTGGTIAFTNASKIINTGASAAVSLATNPGATINFTGGGLDLDTTSGAGFNATGGGTISVQGAGNSITSTTGTALNVANTTIGASGLTFQSISANGAASGIILNGTGSGSLTVTGTGASTSGTAGTIAASLGTGGTIQNTTGDAIALTGVAGGVTLRSMVLGNTSADATTANSNVNVAGDGITIVNSDNIVLENVRIGETGGHGIDGQNVTNLRLTNVAILNAGNADNEDGVNFNGESTNQIDGLFVIKNSVISASFENNVNVSNTSGTLDVSIAGSTFGANDVPNGNDSLLVETLGTAQMDVVVTTSTFTSAAGDLFQFTTNGTGGGLRDTLWFKDNVLTNNHGAIATGGGGVSIFGGATGGFAFNIENNTFRDSVGGAVLIVKTSNGNFLMEGYFKGNTIGASGVANSGSKEGSALKMQTIGGGTLNVAVQNNTIFGYNNFGIELLAGGGAAATGGNFFATVTGNTVSQPGNTVGTEAISKNGLHLNAGTTPADSFLIALNATGNNFSASGKDGIPPTGVGDIDIRLRQRQATTVELPGYAGANNDNAAVGTFVDGNNTGTDTMLVSNTVPTGGGYMNAAARALPSVLPTPPAPLFFAPSSSSDLSSAEGPDAVAPPAMEDAAPVVPLPVIVDDGVLSQAELDSLVGAAIARWEATGLTAEQSARLHRVIFTVANLSGWNLGAAGDGVVTLDADAAGNSWFIDPTPGDDSEFSGAGPQLFATANGGAHGRVDALTTVLHELGHQVGLDDSYVDAHAADLMYGFLHQSERRLPAFGEAEGAVPHDHDEAHALTFSPASLSLGAATLPAGKALTIVYDGTINAALSNGLAPTVSSQIRFAHSGGNVDGNTVATTLDSLTLGGQVWIDADGNTVFNSGTDTGANAVALTLFQSDGTTQVTTGSTNGSGVYQFTGLLPGDYLVRVNASSFGAAQPLSGKISISGGGDPDDNVDHDDNGVDHAAPGTNGIRSLPITLAYNTEPTAGVGNDTNNTLDFGFKTLTADLSITKTDGSATEIPGTNVTYTIVVSNAGPEAVTGATVADTFPASLSSVTWTAVAAGGATGTLAGSGNLSELVNLPSGGSLTYTATGLIAATATGTLVNTATIAAPGGVNDPTPGNNSATDTDTLTPQADLQITKTDGKTVTAPGANTYTIVVSNVGPSSVTGATVADTFPAGFTGATWTAVVAGGATGTLNGNGNLSQTVNLPSGSSITYTVNGTVPVGTTGTLSNTATVTAPGGVTDPTPGNDSATDTTAVVSNDLSITKTDGAATDVPGTTLTYTIVVSNSANSTDAANGALVADTFSSNLRGVTWTAVAAGGATGTLAGSIEINESVNLPINSSITYTVTGTIDPAATGSLVNTATVTAPVGFTEADAANNSATDTTTLTPQADLSITKTDGTASEVPGTTATYTIVVANSGPSTATGVNIGDTFPAILTGVTYTATGSGNAAGFTATGSGDLNDTSVVMPSGSSITYIVTGTVAASATGTLVNTATVSTAVTDPTPGNNSATDTDVLTPQVDLSITKTDHRLTILAGAANTYTIVVRNTGPSDVTGATVTDSFPAEFTGATWSTGVTGGATATANGAGNINDTVSLPAGSTITYTVAGTILVAATGTISNSAAVAAPGSVTDSDSGNNSATDTTEIVVAPDLRVTISDGVNATTAGSMLTYALAFANNGTAASAGVGLSVALPVGVTFTAADNVGWTLAGSTAQFAIGALAAGANGNAALKLTVKDPIPLGLFSLSTTATIADDGTNGADANPADNVATDLDALPPVQLVNGGKAALYLDVDGDLVTVKTSKGAFELPDFTIRAAGLGIIVERLLLAGDDGFKNTTLTWSAKPQPGNRGDGLVNIGAIDATGLDLAGVTIPGDLGQIDAGSGGAKPAALGSLAVQSLGRFGLNTQNAGLTPSLESTIAGPLGKLTVKTDLDGAFVNVTGANGTIGAVNIGRSLLGAAGNNSGSIQSAQNMGTVKIGGHLFGGGGTFSGTVHSQTTIKSVAVGGSLAGGAGANSGSIVGDVSLGAVAVKFDVRSATPGSGLISSPGAITSAFIGGSVVGGSISSSGGAIGNVTIAGSLSGHGLGVTGILAATTIGAVKIGGDFGLGGEARISAGGTANPATAKAALAIKSVSIGGSGFGALIAAGYDLAFDAINADVAIGPVAIKGDWRGVIAAGIADGGNELGTDNDLIFGGGGDPEILATVASVSIGGVARGSTGGPVVVTAEKIGAFKTGATTMPLTEGFDDLIVGTNDFRLRELSAPTPLVIPVIPVFVAPEFSDNNRTATYTDVDGDLVTIKTSAGELSLANILTFAAGPHGGAQLQRIDLANVAAFEGANLSITATRTAAGGNGFVDVGALDASGINLGKVSIAGDLGQLEAGNADPTKPALGSLTVQSLGAAGTDTQLPGGDLRVETKGGLGALVVKTDLVAATVRVGGGENGALNDGPLGKLGSVSIGRSLIGALADTGVIFASGTLGKVTVGGDVRGSLGDRSGSIRATGAMGDVTIGGALIGGLGVDSGSVAGSAGVGNVTVKGSLIGGANDRAGSIAALGGDLKSAKIGGDFLGGSDQFAGAILSATGAIGSVSIGGSLLALGHDRTGVFSDTTLGTVKVSGDVLGGNGFTAKISAQGLDAPLSAAKALAIKSVEIGGVARFVRVLAGFDLAGAATNPDVQIGAVKVKGDWIAGDIAAGVDPSNLFFADGDDASILGGGNATIASRIGAIVIGGQAAGTFGGADHFGFTAEQLGGVKVGKSAFKLGKKPTDPLDNLALGITLDFRAREV